METLKENLESKIFALDKLLKEETDLKTYLQKKAMKKAFEYCLDKINERPKWVYYVTFGGYFMLGLCLGFILAIVLTHTP